MQNLINDLSDLNGNNDVNGIRRNEHITFDTFRMRVQNAGGAVVLESVDYGLDRVFLCSQQSWTGPDDAADEPDQRFMVAHILMDGYLASFESGLNLNDAHAQWCEWTKDDIL